MLEGAASVRDASHRAALCSAAPTSVSGYLAFEGAASVRAAPRRAALCSAAPTSVSDSVRSIVLIVDAVRCGAERTLKSTAVRGSTLTVTVAALVRCCCT